jgi:putative membrane protein
MNIENRLISTAACGITLLTVSAIAFAASLSRTDREFVNSAARINMTEAHEGEMAATQAGRADVKDFARMLVQDHSQAYGQLEQIAEKTGATIPRGINAAHNATIEQLVSLKGGRFDQKFAADQVAALHQALAVYKREADHGQDAALKAYAAGMVPRLEKELQQAQSCAKPSRHS